MRFNYAPICKHDMMKRIALCIPIFFLLLSNQGYAQNTTDPEGEFKAATNSLVLLKNHGHILPLDINQINSIALIGPTIYQPGMASEYAIEDLRNYISPYMGMLNHAGQNIYLHTALGVNIKYDVQALDTSMVYIGQGVNGFSAKYYNNLKASGSPAKFRIFY